MREEQRLLHAPLSLTAAQAAYAHGGAWHEALKQYLDENFEEHTEEFTGIRARVFQHEYDHLEGKVFTDRLSPLRRTLLKRKLNDIANGKVNPGYKMKRPHTKKK